MQQQRSAPDISSDMLLALGETAGGQWKAGMEKMGWQKQTTVAAKKSIEPSQFLLMKARSSVSKAGAGDAVEEGRRVLER